MHGVKRNHNNASMTADFEANEAHLIQEYTLLLSALKDNQQSIEHTTALLLVNPEHYSAWNIRKQIVRAGSSLLLTRPFVDQEMAFSLACIKANPKSYSAWQHRKWFLVHLNTRQPRTLEWIDFDQELALLGRLLDFDSRNCTMPLISNQIDD